MLATRKESWRAGTAPAVANVESALRPNAGNANATRYPMLALSLGLLPLRPMGYAPLRLHLSEMWSPLERGPGLGTGVTQVSLLSAAREAGLMVAN